MAAVFEDKTRVRLTDIKSAITSVFDRVTSFLLFICRNKRLYRYSKLGTADILTILTAAGADY